MVEITKESAQSSLEPGTLWARATAQTQYALAVGALHSIPTESTVIEQDGIHFLVRILANLARKTEAKQRKQQTGIAGQDFNPFLPYDRDLFVADLSDTHVCLLNKYNVVDHHLLIITREFEEQETLLTFRDFEALGYCLTEIVGLGFYNSGKLAGASQRHKHLQLVPLPLMPTGENIPIESAFTAAIWHDSIAHSPVLPFRHAMTQLNWDQALSTQQRAQAMLDAYYSLLTALDLYNPADSMLQGAYNLLVTRNWMLLVPRCQEEFGSIPVNSLGFAGTLFVRNQQQLEQLQAIGPLNLLQGVAVAVATEKES